MESPPLVWNLNDQYILHYYEVAIWYLKGLTMVMFRVTF